MQGLQLGHAGQARRKPWWRGIRNYGDLLRILQKAQQQFHLTIIHAFHAKGCQQASAFSLTARGWRGFGLACNVCRLGVLTLVFACKPPAKLCLPDLYRFVGEKHVLNASLKSE